MPDMESLSNQLINDYLTALGTAMSNAGQIVPWPLHLAQIGPYYDDIEARDIYDRLRAKDAAGAYDLDIGSLFLSASSGKSLLMDLIPGLKEAEIEMADRVWCVGRILDGLAAVETGDVLCRDGAHRLLSDQEAEQVAHGCPHREQLSESYPRSAFALSGAAQAVIWSQHFYGWTDIGFVIHGPYEIPDAGEQLVIRDFIDLSATELWPQSASASIRRLRICSLHDRTDRYSVDIFNHLLHSRAQLDSCVAVSVECDGVSWTDPAALDALRRELTGIVRGQQAAIAAMSTQQVLAKFVESRYYALRLWRAPGDWHPVPEVYQRIKDRPIEPAPPEGDWTLLRKLFDPRLEFSAL